MKIILDTEKCPVEIKQALLLLLLNERNYRGQQHMMEIRESRVLEDYEKLRTSGYVSKSIINGDTWWRLTTDGEKMCEKLTQGEPESIAKERYTALADKLRQLYPEGKKPGLQEYWRDSTNTISERLKKFFEKYGDYTDEEIIEATKQYVAHFNGNFRYMKLLKYFIWKQVVKGGELVEGRMVGEVEKESELLSYIQNLREHPEPTFQADWDVQLK